MVLMNNVVQLSTDCDYTAELRGVSRSPITLRWTKLLVWQKLVRRGFAFFPITAVLHSIDYPDTQTIVNCM